MTHYNNIDFEPIRQKSVKVFVGMMVEKDIHPQIRNLAPSNSISTEAKLCF